MKLTINIVYRMPGRDDGEYHIVTKTEDPNGAGIVVEEVYARGFDIEGFNEEPHTVKPEDIVYVMVLPAHD